MTNICDEECEDLYPERILYYPNCGCDLRQPFRMFFEDIDTFEFADINPTFEVPKMVEDVLGKQTILKHEIIDHIATFPLPWLENVPIKVRIKCFKYYLSGNKLFKYNIVDSVLYLLYMDKIDILFYKGDSGGEGGSGQSWFSPSISSLVLNKINKGGKIVTDGSNLWMLRSNDIMQTIISDKQEFFVHGRNMLQEKQPKYKLYFWIVT